MWRKVECELKLKWRVICSTLRTWCPGTRLRLLVRIFPCLALISFTRSFFGTGLRPFFDGLLQLRPFLSFFLSPRRVFSFSMFPLFHCFEKILPDTLLFPETTARDGGMRASVLRFYPLPLNVPKFLRKFAPTAAFFGTHMSHSRKTRNRIFWG